MADRSRSAMLRLRALVLAFVACLVIVPAASAQTGSPALAGWLANGTTFPQRGLDLFPPAGTALTAGRVHVTENGHAAGPLTITPVSQAGPGDFGVMVVLDESASQSTGSLVSERTAALSFAAQRSGQQQLGVIAFAGQSHLLVAPTTDSGQVNAGLAVPLQPAGGANLSDAISLAVNQLTKSGVALGAIVVVSDGAGNLTPAGSANAAALRSAVTSAGVPVIGIGVRDASASLSTLARVVPGQVVDVAPSRLTSTLSSVWPVLQRAYVVRWRSSQPSATNVAVQARVDGLTGTVQASYRSGTQTAAPAAHPRPADLTHALTIDLAHTPALVATPSFVAPAAAAASSTPITIPASMAPAGAAATSAAASPPGFLHTTPGELIIALICGLLFAAAVWLLLPRANQHGVRARVGSYLPTDVDADVDDPDALLHGNRQDSGNAFSRSRWWIEFVENVEVSRNPKSPKELVRQGLLGGLIVCAVLTYLSGSYLVGLAPLLGWPLALRAIVARAARKHRDKFRDTLPGYLQDLASALRVGRSFVSAVSVVADGADEPTKSELERAVTDDQLGRPLEESLESIAERMQAPDMAQVALVAALNRKSGSNVAEALDRVADGARDRADLRREVRALTAQAKMSSSVLTALPGLLLAGISVISPQYAYPLLHTTVGIVLLVIGGVMVFAGWKVMKKISNVKT